MRFHPSILAPNPAVRQRIVTVLAAALAAVDPYGAVLRVLQRDGNHLHSNAGLLAAWHRDFVAGMGRRPNLNATKGGD